MDLIFSRPLPRIVFGSKVYARTPAGEYAFADGQGLYEWRNGELIRYSGGDRQCSSDGAMWITHANPGPYLRGFHSALSGRRLN